MNVWLDPAPQDWLSIVEDAVLEDVGPGDVTAPCIPLDHMVNWKIEAQADGVVCGVGIAEHLLGSVIGGDEQVMCEVKLPDGSRVRRGDILIEGRNFGREVMSLERTALNFLMQLSGVATLTSAFVERVQGSDARIVDTRKTVPLLRSLQKYAVRCGGGHNHRMGLFDAAMLKDNHIAVCGGIAPAVKLLRRTLSHLTRIEVECETLDQVQEAVSAGADVVLLDNMDPFMMREAVSKYRNACLFEASGGITLETVAGVAATGVDIISVGALTHSAPALSLHLEIA